MTKLPLNNQSKNHEAIISELMKEMKSLSSYKRAEAIKQLGRLQISPSELPLETHSILEKSLYDPELEVRRETVMALAFLEGKIAIPLIEPLLTDSSQSVRSNVIAALSFIGNKPSEKTVDILIQYLKDSEPEIRDRCARALGRMNITEANDDLLSLAKNDPSPIVRSGAIVGLGLIKRKDPSLSASLLDLISNETSPIVINAIKEAFEIINSSF